MPPPTQCYGSRRVTPDFVAAALAQPTAMLQRWMAETRPDIPGIAGGPWTIDPRRGNLKLILAPPEEGPSVPAIALVYNSQSAEIPTPGAPVPRRRRVTPALNLSGTRA